MNDEREAVPDRKPPPRAGSGSHRDADGTDPAQDAAGQDLLATSDAIREDINRLAAIEGAKQALPPEDPQVDRMSDEAIALAERIERETRIERELSEELR
jgi:hypothetical protein